MPRESLSHFAEKSGIVACSTPWGRWWQTVHEVYVDVNVPPGTKAKQVKVDVTPKFISCQVANNELFKGQLFSTVKANETLWTIEDNCLLTIVLTKATPQHSEEIWEALLQNKSFEPDPFTLHEMRKKLDLEKFQIENPGMDFSHAQLQKNYDKPPGWSQEFGKGTDSEP